MFSVPLLVAVAGVLLMSDTNQANTAVSRSPTVSNLYAAWVENQNAIRVLTTLIERGLPFTGVIGGIMLAQGELEELRKNKTKNRLETLTSALGFERFGYFAPGECTGHRECNDSSGYVQHATANMIGVVLEELTDQKKIEEIKKVINGTIKESGDLVDGASVEKTKAVATEVLGLIY